MNNPNILMCISKAMCINKVYDFSIYKKTKGFKENHYKERFIKFSNFDREDFILVPNLTYDFELELSQNELSKKFIKVIKSLLNIDPSKRVLN